MISFRRIKHITFENVWNEHIKFVDKKSNIKDNDVLKNNFTISQKGNRLFICQNRRTNKETLDLNIRGIKSIHLNNSTLYIDEITEDKESPPLTLLNSKLFVEKLFQKALNFKLNKSTIIIEEIFSYDFDVSISKSSELRVKNGFIKNVFIEMDNKELINSSTVVFGRESFVQKAELLLGEYEKVKINVMDELKYSMSVNNSLILAGDPEIINLGDSKNSKVNIKKARDVKFGYDKANIKKMTAFHINKSFNISVATRVLNYPLLLKYNIDDNAKNKRNYSEKRKNEHIEANKREKLSLEKEKLFLKEVNKSKIKMMEIEQLAKERKMKISEERKSIMDKAMKSEFDLKDAEYKMKIEREKYKSSIINDNQKDYGLKLLDLLKMDSPTDDITSNNRAYYITAIEDSFKNKVTLNSVQKENRKRLCQLFRIKYDKPSVIF